MLSNDESILQQALLYEAQGMNTIFQFRFLPDEKSRAEQLAGQCTRKLEELEAELSRFQPDSEVSRINSMQKGESLILADATYRCLQRSVEAMSLTAGLFDVTLGALTWNDAEQRTLPNEMNGKLQLVPNRPEIICEEAGRQIDFGGIGKGFSLDDMAKELSELDVFSALLSAGASTHLAMGKEAWPFDLQGDDESIRIELVDQALSASGIEFQGAHVIHPDTGLAPHYTFKRVWVITQSAALADAFSTACLLMNEEEVRAFVAALAGKVQVYAEYQSSEQIVAMH